ncbi:hypothetical protein [Actinomadura bangladeshensis]|uniref:ABM domain-containing protein n=1 Tax=Actinomadura bangladeshensis TaxID=453573 RepID=A0A4R4P7A6_9ACTN|nr:hypothetical protein [Actinomadura bangladeshensis]TDC18388.1 hypothetical protein E1284_06620 [Actinomadura bangladeshensis]
MRVMIRYAVKPELVDHSLELLRQVYSDLESSRPPRLRYETFRLEGTDQFMAIIESDGGPAEAAHHHLLSFQRYRTALNEICTQLPSVTHLESVGAYQFR